MTINSFSARPLLALAALLVTAPLMADEGTVVTGRHRDTGQELVNFADLNLLDGSDRVTLRHPVAVAAERICDRLGEMAGVVSASDVWDCADRAYSDARPQISEAIHRAKSGQRMAMNLVISAPERIR